MEIKKKPKYPFEEKSVEELLADAIELMKNASSKELTFEEIAEQDAEDGYFEDD